MAVTEKRISKSKRKRVAKVDVALLRSRLLGWYDASHRPLPWREDTDPYRVWISEIMLQQTRVEAVTPYYTRWLRRFPSLEALAGSDLQDVFKEWEGLGYYSRARNLHGAARLVRERFGGTVPNTYQKLRALPGIGDYTAGAIASISFGERVPAVDGNVRRVLARVFDVEHPSPAALREEAERLVDPLRPGDFNQAVMELGATVCTPRSPLCDRCPLATVCRARANGTVGERPARKTRKPVPHETVNTLICLRDDSVLLLQRPETGLLAGLWEFPAIEAVPARARVIGQLTHTFTHKRITYVVHLLRTRRAPVKGQWTSLAELHTFALPAAQRKIEKLFQTAGNESFTG